MSFRPNLWDNIQASTRKAMNQAGDAASGAAQKTKLRTDILLIDRDIATRKQKFGVDTYSHLEGTTSTQEFYVAEDRLINIIRPTLIKAQKEVAAYERKRDILKSKVNAAEAARAGSASVISAATFADKFRNAAKYASAGATEARLRTELAVIERQILGFKEDFGKELYPVFHSMEDNEGWLPTDRKLRTFYDAAREDITKLENRKKEKNKRISALGEAGGSEFKPPSPTPGVPVAIALGTPTMAYVGQHAAAPINDAQAGVGQMQMSTNPSAYDSPHGAAYVAAQPAGSGIGTTAQIPVQNSFEMQQRMGSTDQTNNFHFLQSENGGTAALAAPAQNGMSNTAFQQQPYQQQPTNNMSSMFDPIGGINSGSGPAISASASQTYPSGPAHSAPINNAQGGQLNDADLNLFKY